MKFIAPNLLDYIPVGAENAVSGRKLADICGCSERDVRKSVERLRREGVLILSSCNRNRGGYYRPRDSTETASYFKRQLSRISHIWAALSPFKRFLAALPIEGQTALDELLKSDGDSNEQA